MGENLLLMMKQDNVEAYRTWSLPNAVCFKHDSNVCTCAVSALILLPIVNLPLEMFSATSVSYTAWKCWPPDAAFCIFWRFFTAYAQLRPCYTASRLKSNVIFKFSAAIFLYIRGNSKSRNTSFHYSTDTIKPDYPLSAVKQSLQTVSCGSLIYEFVYI